jgi:outer membrane receptor protein involved in Fe transport
MGHRTMRLAVSLVAALAFTPSLSNAQTVSGTVEGTIQDSQGGRLPGVNLELRSTETGQLRTTVTNEQGFFKLAFVPIGRYRVSTDLSGFGRKVREIEVRLNSTSVVDLTLSPSLTEDVLVTADAPRINTTSGTIQSSLTSEQIMEKPTAMNLNNVNQFLSLAETFAGFQENPTSGQNNPTASSGSSINFNGTGTRGATFQINGVNNDDYSENQNRQGVPLATIKEFQVVSNSYSAEFGRGYGAVVLVQTKQGTNAVKGEMYGSRRDNDWNERSFFAPFPAAKPINSRNVFGGVIGAPIKKDKLFAFLSIEHARESGEGTYTRDLIIAADKALPRLTRGNDTPANRAFIESVIARFGSLTPNDPLNRSNRTFVGIQEFDRPVRDYSGRLDYNMSAKDHVTARFQFSKQLFTSDDIIVGEATQQRNNQKNFGITWTRTFSPRATGEFRYGLGIRDTNVEIKDGNTTPVIRFAGTPVSGSIIGNAGTFPILRDQLDHQFVYNFTTLFGDRHALKLGTDIRLSQLDDVSQSFNRGFWNFTNICGGTTYSSAYAAFFDGCVTTYQKAYGPDFLENRIKEYNFYVQDDFKVRPNLTLNLGVRYEIAGAPTEAKNRITYGYKTDKDNIEPRFGFAWTPNKEGGIIGSIFGGPGNGSLRGGYGINHGRLFQSIFSQGGASVRTNPPNAASLSFSGSTNLADPSNGFVFQPGGTQTARITLTEIDPNLRMPYTHSWNLTVERKIPWNSSFRVTYSGTRGKDMLRYSLSNLPVAPGAPGSTYVLAANYLCAGTGTAGVATNAACPVAVPIAANEISNRVPRTNERRPDARYNTNTVVSNQAQSWYDGVQFEWLKRFSHGLDFQVNYTRSSAQDTTSEATFVGAGDSNQLGPDAKLTKGYSRFHTPHRFTLSGYYRLPVFADRRDLVGQVLGGWTLGFVAKVASGTPFTVIDTGGIDLNFDGFAEGRPVLVDQSLIGVVVNDPANSTTKLPLSAFRRATPEDYAAGNLSPRNKFFGDGVRTLDLVLSKTFKPISTHRLVLRIEAYNVTNAVLYAFPTTDINNVNFGRITGGASAYSPRTLQVGARYIF